MSRRFFHGQVVAAERRALLLPLLAGCFFLGALLGNAAAAREMAAESGELQQYLSSFFTLLRAGKLEQLSFWADVIAYCKYPVLLFLVGCFGFGVPAVPGLLFYQGFSVSFAVSAFLSATGVQGVVCAALLFGFRCLFVLPCSLLIAQDAVQRAWQRLRRRGERKKEFRGQYVFLRFFLCIVLLMVGAALEYAVLPDLLQHAAAGCTFE